MNRAEYYAKEALTWGSKATAPFQTNPKESVEANQQAREAFRWLLLANVLLGQITTRKMAVDSDRKLMLKQSAGEYYTSAEKLAEVLNDSGALVTIKNAVESLKEMQ